MNNGSTRKRMKIARRLAAATLFAAAFLLTASAAWAKSGADGRVDLQRYVVELIDPPLSAYDGGELSAPGPRGPLRLAATAPDSTGEKRLDPGSAASLAYLAYLAERHAEFTAELQALLGREVEVPHRYRYATNGFALHLSAEEAERVRAMPQVRSLEREQIYRLQTFAGPGWLGADALWSGVAGYPAARGEGVVVGVIDTGINWNHPSFSDNPQDGYTYSNPFGAGLGLCSEPEVLCNDKLVGVYDFVTDDPGTTEYVEENTNGEDNNGHGSHTASIAAGNAVTVTVDGSNRTLSGVAPRANVVSYRVCYMGEPNTEDSEGCQGSAIIAAIDRAVADGVDVINYSIGGTALSPWRPGSADRAFLEARGAGVFVASSAGNDGPNPGTVSSPALAPWIVAVGNATHNRINGARIENFSGGSLPPPDAMVGATLRSGTGKLPIVHARDYGFPLCGTGPAELGADCASNTGKSNPWAGTQPFNGEIVVCDRGTYGRIEKGKNVLLAGAGGYILANSGDSFQEIVADAHCLSAVHVTREDGDVLREWLGSGTGHGAQLSAVYLAETDAVADRLASSSSRGPAGESTPEVANVLKPNLIAPGTRILAAYFPDANDYAYLTGTSMASPHVAGAAALLKSVHPDWSANELASALETTATAEIAKDEDGNPATAEEVGAGRPQVDQAVNAGLYLEVSRLDFLTSNPDPQVNGDPRNLNLPGLVDAECKTACTFTRRVTDLMGGGSWTATPEGFPAGAVVTVTPNRFDLASAATRALEIRVDVSGTGIIGDWVSGKIRLSAAGAAEQYLTVSVKSFGGKLPEMLEIADNRDAGWKAFELDGLVALPNATFTSGGLARQDSRTETLLQDPTDSDAYDGGTGVFTSWYTLDDGALWLYAETPASSSDDVDLFVGRDDNGNGIAEEWEELCSSTSPQNVERCSLNDLPPGDYWIVVQNWLASGPAGDAVTLLSVAVEQGEGSGLAASGPGIVGADEAFDLRLSWDGLAALPGETWYGAVGVGTRRDAPNNLGVIPVRFYRTGVAAAKTLPLVDGLDHGLALAAGGVHDLAFIDVPPGTASLSVSANGANATQSNGLAIDLVRLDFDEAIATPPFATPAGGRQIIVTATGGGGQGPAATISGGVEPGRWYAVVRNTGSQAAAVTLRADVQSDGTQLDLHPGLWFPAAPRSWISQGYEINWGDGANPAYALIWYTYDEAGQPAWYIAGANREGGNLWTADLLRVTNDGGTQQLAPVGHVSVAMLARDDALFSFTLFGESGSERMQILSPLTCPNDASYTGLWYRGQEGLGGASVLVNSASQAQIHYLFDAAGLPRWLIASEAAGVAPDAPTIPFQQFSGFCAVCAETSVSSREVGSVDRAFASETSGSWTLDYVFAPPLSGSVERTDSIVKLTRRLDCL